MIIKNVLIALYNKDGIEVLLDVFKENNINIYASTGTADYIEKHGYNVKRTEEITGISSLLDGRVKTLDTKLFSGILARKGIDNTKDIPVIFDMVIVDLYPFNETVKANADEEEIIEKIDIGGVSLIRAAAKNYKFVSVVCKKEFYKDIANKLTETNCNIEEEYNRILAENAFEYTMKYDASIYEYFKNDQNSVQSSELLMLEKGDELRYGENPHQKAKIYRLNGDDSSIIDFDNLHGKKMSFNNYYDLDAALNIVSIFEKPCAAIIKHANPCGVGTSDTIEDAYELAHMGDPMSAYGGIVALNRCCNKETAEIINSSFIEIVSAPDYDDDALNILKQKRNIRILKGKYPPNDEIVYKHIRGGMLVQKRDNQQDSNIYFSIVSKRKPTDKELSAMKFAWKVARNVKSNAIVIATQNRTLGIGAGQMSRIDAVEIAIKKSGGMSAYTGCTALASDGFFPFKDSIEKAYKAGIYAIIEPGGSKRDMDIINACDEYDIALIFTNTRHFLH